MKVARPGDLAGAFSSKTQLPKSGGTRKAVLLLPRGNSARNFASHQAFSRESLILRRSVMGLFTRDIKSLEDLFNHTLQDIYYAEQQILKTLPKLIENASEPQLKKDLKGHLEETKEQVRRLRNVFTMLKQEPKGTRCPGIDGILSEGDSLLGNVDGRSVTNAAIVASAQAVEHYEITRYGALIAWATELGRNELVSPLEANLREEKAADRKLTAVAESRINKKAKKNGAPHKRRGARRPPSRTSAKRKATPARKSA
jgi:ferritin-like metal-binding protein YciE